MLKQDFFYREGRETEAHRYVCIVPMRGCSREEEFGLDASKHEYAARRVQESKSSEEMMLDVIEYIYIVDERRVELWTANKRRRDGDAHQKQPH